MGIPFASQKVFTHKSEHAMDGLRTSAAVQ